MQLAIDTSTDTASLAIVKDHEIVAELTWHCQKNHSQELIPNMSQLLKLTKLEFKSISHIIVARGPGSFNGLRVGLSCAKVLAFSLKIPLVGISTLEAEAYQHAEIGLPVCSILGAGRSEISAAIYQKKDNQWHQLSGEHITTVEALCSKITDKTIFCGQISPTIASQLEVNLKELAVIPSPSSRLRRAGFLAELGLKRLKAGDFDHLATLQPIYLRRPAITKSKR
jgi:tRNA threonylcarbamoyl adenosine modification protein YeaZ|tara:strand:- start:92 stop:769 length:678 start_codon:yes stop_codon:yes gene_type:complete